MTNSQKKTIKWYQDHSKKFDNYLSMKEVDGIVIIKTETEDYSIGIRGGVTLLRI